MAAYAPLDSQACPFHPPAISTLVSCLHCGQEYDSFRIEWRIEPSADGQPHGFWCCPVAGCDGKGFGFDIFPVDPDFQDERGGWFADEAEADEDREDESAASNAPPRGLDADGDDEIPF